MAGRVDIHVVQLESARHGSTWTRWTCTCGRRSRLFGCPGYAEGAGRNHANAHGGWMRGRR